MTGSATTDTIAVTVHGPTGALDLLVPVGAAVADVAREYAASLRPAAAARAAHPGRPAAARVRRPGDRRRRVRRGADRRLRPTPASRLLRPRAASDRRTTDQVGRHRRRARGARSRRLPVSSPGCSPPVPTTPSGRPPSRCSCSRPPAASCPPAGSPPSGPPPPRPSPVAAAFAAAWQPGADRLPLLVGIAGLGAAAAAGATRAAGASGREVQNVWIASGIGVFLVAGGSLLAGFAPQVAWGVMVILALLAARSVPAYAVDVPDQMLIDLEKLAVTAWSARDRTTGRRGRMIIPEAGVRDLLVARRHDRRRRVRRDPRRRRGGRPRPARHRHPGPRPDRRRRPGLLRRRRAAARRPQLSPRAGPFAAADLRALRLGGAGRDPVAGRARAHPVVRRRRGAGARRGGAAWRRSRPAGAGARCGGRAVPRSASRCAARSRSRRSWSPPGCSGTCGS